jgi:predicted transcriptional regulator
MTLGITSGKMLGMKTAVSIPNDVFRRAERLAKRQKQTRSALYARAIREYIARHDADAIRDAIDSSIREHGDEVTPGALEAGADILRRTEWQE